RLIKASSERQPDKKRLPAHLPFLVHKFVKGVGHRGPAVKVPITERGAGFRKESPIDPLRSEVAAQRARSGCVARRCNSEPPPERRRMLFDRRSPYGKINRH